LRKPLKALILAAGQGKRMRTDGADLPKVMRLANGKPLLYYALSALDFIAEEDRILVVGYMRDKITEAFPMFPTAIQEEQLGTGHAVTRGMETLGDFDGDILVCCGDMPLIRKTTYQGLIDEHRKNGAKCTLLTGTSDEKLPYGRILRGGDGGFVGIAEEKDCTPEQLAITELNAGVYVFDAAALRDALNGLSNKNAQGEYYLTDVPLLIARKGGSVAVRKTELSRELIGVNTPEQLAEVERELINRGSL